MDKIRPSLFDTVIGLIFILLPGIRGYSDWQIHEYGLIQIFLPSTHPRGCDSRPVPRIPGGHAA